MSDTLPEMLERRAADSPEVTLDFPGQGSTLSLAELPRLARRVAGALHRQGVGPGEPVGLLLDTSPQFLLAFFGVLYAGAVPTPLAVPSFLGQVGAHLSRLRHILAAAEMKRMITVTRCASFLRQPALAVQTIDADSLLDFRTPAPALAVAPEDLALIQYTSGSTSQPKGVALTHRNVLAGIRAIVTGARLTPEDRNCQWLPLHHDMGLIGTLTGIAVGLPQQLWPPSRFVRDPARWLAAWVRFGATLYLGPNFSYAYLAESVPGAVLKGLDLSRWRVAFNGAERIEPGCLKAFASSFGPSGFRPSTMFPVYGLAEATLAVAFPELGSTPAVQWVDTAALANDRRAVPVPPHHVRARGVVGVGRAVLNHEIRIATEDGEPLPPGTVGEIQVRGPAIMRGYYRETAETKKALALGWLQTGDLGYVSDGGLFVTGRSKEMAIVRGVNHYPEDVESLVSTLDEVRSDRAVAFSLTSASGEQMVVLVETRLPGGVPRRALAEQIRAHISTQLGLDTVDVYLLRPHSIRKTTSGKRQRLLMRDALVAGELDAAILEFCGGSPPERSHCRA